jgi:hypothetical protein
MRYNRNMTITIVPEVANEAGVVRRFRAQAGTFEATGPSVGTALDALTAQWSGENELSNTLVLVQQFRPDRFFTRGQQERLRELMDKWRIARDTGSGLPAAEQTELENLVQAEVEGMAERADALLSAETK